MPLSSATPVIKLLGTYLRKSDVSSALHGAKGLQESFRKKTKNETALNTMAVLRYVTQLTSSVFERVNQMTTIKLTYKAFGNIPERNKEITSVEFNVETGATLDLDLMDLIYEATNLQDELYAFGAKSVTYLIWEIIKPLLSPNRTHSSLSVGDEIQIGARVYQITDDGFRLCSVTGFAESI